LRIRKDPAIWRGLLRSILLDCFDVGCLQTLGALFDGEFHLLAFFEVAETIGLNGREMDENIRTAIAGDESVTLAAIKPFDRTDYTFRHFLPPKQKKKKDIMEQYVFHRPVNKKTVQRHCFEPSS